MYRQDYPEVPAEAAGPAADPEQSRLSRRSMIRRSAGFGAVGLALVAGGGTAAAVLSSHGSKGAGSTALGATTTGVVSNPGAIVIYIPDPTTGDMTIFSGAGQTHASNKAMATMVKSMAPK